MREQFITSYLRDSTVYAVIWHDRLTYAKVVIVGGFSRLVMRLVFILLQDAVFWNWWSFAFGWIGVLLYLRTIYALLDQYLDVLVISDLWLIMLSRNGFFSYQTTIIQRTAIERVSEEQHSLLDTLLQSGDITVKVEDEIYHFTNVTHPTETVASLLHRKQKMFQKSMRPEPTEAPQVDKDKFNLLVEALGEVVSEYVDKKHTH
jgi:hypothetical protein